MAKQELTIGKFRGLQQTSTERGMFTMLALDHQESRTACVALDMDEVSQDDARSCLARQVPAKGLH